MHRFRSVIGLGSLWLLLVVSPFAVAEEEVPHTVIESTATALSERLQDRRDYYADNSAELYALVNELLLPGFDVEYAGKQVLGRKHWTAATVEQRERFTEAFYGFLVRTYAKGLLGFDQENLRINPTPVYSDRKDKALVRTSLTLTDGSNVEVNYALRMTDSGWKIYDVRIDGVSYIRNYRNQFDAEISADGLDAVIGRLEDEAAGGSTKG